MLHKIKIDLKSEEDLLWNFERVKMVWVNQMYTGWKIKWRKGKRSTPELIVYKNFLRNKISEYIKKNKDLKYDIEKPIFYVINFKLDPKKRKDWEIDQTAISDIDWYIKPIQDSFETKRDSKTWEILELWFWKNDRYIKGFLPFVEYDDKWYDSFEIIIMDYNDKLIKKIKNNFKI